MKKVILFSAAALLTINVAGTALANVQPDPNQEAIQDIIDQRPVDEAAVQQRGDDYAQAFLQAFALQSKVYQQAYANGIADGKNGRTNQPSGQVATMAYQRGWQHGKQLHKVGTGSYSQKVPNNVGVNSVDSNGDDALDKSQLMPDRQETVPQKLTLDQRAFINRLAGPAQRVGREYDLYPSVIIAQAALESNWGNSGLARAPFHNIFGIKGYFAGQSTNQPTIEYQAGQRLQLNDHFRCYDNDIQSLRDYAQTLADPLYRGVHRRFAANYRQATHALQGRYATDPLYEQKLNQLIKNYHLTKYDQLVSKPAIAHHPVAQFTNVRESSAPDITSHHPTHYHHRPIHHHSFTAIASIIGGASSAGLVEVVRRLVLR